jgi:hypothetical protein
MRRRSQVRAEGGCWLWLAQDVIFIDGWWSAFEELDK